MNTGAVPILGERYSRFCNYHHKYIQGQRAEAREATQKLINGSQLLSVPCLCGDKDESTCIATIDRYGFQCRAVLCSQCGVLRISPRLDDELYGKIYAEHFFTLEIGSVTLTKKRYQLSISRSKIFFDQLDKHVNVEGKKVVEIGCSYGAGLVHLQGKGADIYGYDFDEDILSIGREYSGLELRKGGVDAALADHSGDCDVVILRHVFEHFLDPFYETKQLRKLLNKEGILVIEVPGILNQNQWFPDPARYINVFHVYSYCLRTLKQVMERCGFTLIQGDESIYSFWKKTTKTNVTSWKNEKEAGRILSFIKKMERKRKLHSFLGRMHEKISYMLNKVRFKYASK